MSMSAFQNTAFFLPQTGTVADVSSSVRYLPWEICEQSVTLASRSAALTEPSVTPGRLTASAGAEVAAGWAVAGSAAAASSAVPAAVARAKVRLRTGGPLC